MSSAILLETALSYLGFGITPPTISLGQMIQTYQQAFSTRPWLFWWPGIFIVIIALSVNFIGDGLRDAFDPRQKRIVFRRVKDLPEDAAVVSTSGTVSDVPEGPVMTSSGYATDSGISSQETRDDGPEPRR